MPVADRKIAGGKAIVLSNPQPATATAAKTRPGGGAVARKKPPISARAPLVQTAMGVEAPHESTSSSSASASGDNKAPGTSKVYKYFSTSAKHEYKRGELYVLTEDEELASDFGSDSRVERECFHISDKICPICDAPLKNYESCCLRCQKDLSLRFDSSSNKTNKGATSAQLSDNGSGSGSGNGCGSGHGVAHKHSFALVCVSCQRVYQLCASCVRKRDVCRACHRERNVCMNCRRALCAFCLDEIACGRNTETRHINDGERVADGADAAAATKDEGDSTLGGKTGGATIRVLQKAEVPNECAFRVISTITASPAAAPPPKRTTPTGSESSASDCYTVEPSRRNEHGIIRNNLHTLKANYNNNISFKPLPKILDKQLWTQTLEEQEEPPSVSPPTPPSSTSTPPQRLPKRTVTFRQHNDSIKAIDARSAPQLHPPAVSAIGDVYCDRGTQTAVSTIARREVMLHEAELPTSLETAKPKMTRSDNLHWLHNFMQQSEEQQQHQRPRHNKSSAYTVLTEVGAISRQLKATKLLPSVWRT